MPEAHAPRAASRPAGREDAAIRAKCGVLDFRLGLREFGQLLARGRIPEPRDAFIPGLGVGNGEDLFSVGAELCRAAEVVRFFLEESLREFRQLGDRRADADAMHGVVFLRLEILVERLGGPEEGT